jgi:hypothetical protein
MRLFLCVIVIGLVLRRSAVALTKPTMTIQLPHFNYFLYGIGKGHTYEYQPKLA